MLTEDERTTGLTVTSQEFRAVGHEVIDRIADHFESLSGRPVTTPLSPHDILELLGRGPLPDKGTALGEIFRSVIPLLAGFSLHTTHPRFWGYITGSAAPAGVLADALGSAINPNVGAWILSPVASEIERQAVGWLANLIGYPAGCGGVMVSGGNMANFIGFLAARRAKSGWNIRSEGVRNGPHQLAVYASKETHTWIQKAADLFGLGTDAIRWVRTDENLRMDMTDLAQRVDEDTKRGIRPMAVVGAGGTVGTGVVDPLREIAAFCRARDIWFHVDGAYGAPAAALEEAPEDLKALREADSVALDPHKWLYAPMEAGCALVRDPRFLVDAFSFRPEYYRFDSPEGEERTNFFEYGLQNSRGFRALKVWVQLKQTGREGIVSAIREDISLSREMEKAVRAHPECEVFTQHLSILTFRYLPERLNRGKDDHREYLNELNTRILDNVQREGKMFVSNAVIRETFVLRACIVNFRTTLVDVRSVPGIVAEAGRAIDAELQKEKDQPK